MRILVIDDHALIREGIAQVIRSLDASIEIVQAGTCAAGLEAARDGAFGLVLLDLNLPDQPGSEALKVFRERHPEMPVVIVSGQEDRDTVLRTLELGAKAFIPKSGDPGRLRDAVAALLEGRVFLPDDVLASSILPKAAQAALAEPGTQEELTGRQLEVLALVVAGLPNKLIARKLDIAESTVKIHVSAVMRAFKVASRTQVVLAVAKSGMRLPQL